MSARYLRLPGGRVVPDPEVLDDIERLLRYSDPLDLGALGYDRLFLASVLAAYQAVCSHPPLAAEIRAAKRALGPGGEE